MPEFLVWYYKLRFFLSIDSKRNLPLTNENFDFKVKVRQKLIYKRIYDLFGLL